VKEADMHNDRIKALFQEVETKVFKGRPKLYQIFKKFDSDNDGFVSREDFRQSLSKLQVGASEEEVKAMVKLIDQADKGYLDYSDFSKIFRSDMSETLVSVQRRDNQHPNNVPSKQITSQLIDKQSKMQETIKEIYKGFQPDYDASKSLSQELEPATRFGAKPEFTSTFVNFQQGAGYPGHLTEKERFGRTVLGSSFQQSFKHTVGPKVFAQAAENTLNAKIGFQAEDKMRKTLVMEAKIAKKRMQAQFEETRKQFM
jgi:hypothetical protein